MRISWGEFAPAISLVTGNSVPNIKIQSQKVPYRYVLRLFPERRPSRNMNLNTLRVFVITKKGLHMFPAI